MWIKKAGRIVDERVKERKEKPKDIEILEMDELFTFIKKATKEHENKGIYTSLHQNLDCCG